MVKICCFPGCDKKDYAYDLTWTCLTDDAFQEEYDFCPEHATAIDQKRQENDRAIPAVGIWTGTVMTQP